MFFSYGSTNKLRGFGASKLAPLEVGWKEQLLHFCFPIFDARFLLCFRMILVAVGCIREMLNHGYTSRVDESSPNGLNAMV